MLRMGGAAMTNLVALLFGVAIVIFFSYERFNRTTDEAGKQLQRLVSLLSPDKLRSRRVVMNAYGFYAATFVLIYLFLCAYAELLPVLGGPALAVGASSLPDDVKPAVTGFTPDGPGKDLLDTLWTQTLSSYAGSGETRAFDIGIDSSTSLAVALLIVGLAPSFPILQNFEIWMRGAAHRLAGIPTRVLEIRDELRSHALAIDIKPSTEVPDNMLLITRGDWQRLAWYRSQAERELDSPREFFEDLILVFAVSNWIIERKLKLSNPQERERFVELERDLKERRDALIEKLDIKARYAPASAAAHAQNAGAVPADALVAPDESKSTNWDRLAIQLGELADDMCILLALYTEHEIITGSQVPETPNKLRGEREDGGRARLIPAAAMEDANSETRSAHDLASNGAGDRAVVAQRELARRQLEAFLKDHLASAAGPARSRSFTMVSALWAFFVITIVALLWSQFPGRFEQEIQSERTSDPYWRLALYWSTALMAYFIPVAVALAIRSGWRQFRVWPNMRETGWTVRVPQAAFILFASWLLATLCLLATTLWQAGLAVGWQQNAEYAWRTLRWSFQYNAPTPLRGAMLALLVVLLLDSRQSRTRPLSRSARATSVIWGLSAALALAVTGGVTRLLSSYAGALQAAIPRESLFDSVDRGLIVYAALYSAIIGFCVVFSISEVLLYQRRPLAATAGG